MKQFFSKEHMEKEKKKKTSWRSICLAVIFFLCVIVFLFAAYKICGILLQEKASRDINTSLAKKAVATVAPSEEAPSHMELTPTETVEEIKETAPITADFDILLEECEDIIAWLYCPDTQINYPIVQSENNQYYLHRLPDGSYNDAGTLFADYRCSADFSDWNTVIYGHNMKNDSMFGALPEYADQAYYEAHPILYLLTPRQSYKIELIAGYVTPSDSEVYSIPATAEERTWLVSSALEQSNFTTAADIQSEDRLITLSTCSYEYDTARYVLLGVLREIG